MSKKANAGKKAQSKNARKDSELYAKKGPKPEKQKVKKDLIG